MSVVREFDGSIQGQFNMQMISSSETPRGTIIETTLFVPMKIVLKSAEIEAFIKMLAHFRKIYFFYCFYLIWEISPKRFPQWIIDKANTCLIKCVNRHLLIYFNCLTYVFRAKILRSNQRYLFRWNIFYLKQFNVYFQLVQLYFDYQR